jgi:hypothetical protein
VHLIFMTHGVYSYLITHFADFDALSTPTWSLLAQVIITVLSDLIVRCVFARRIWLLSGLNTWLLLFIVSVSIFVGGMGFAFATRGFIDGSYAKIVQESWILYTALGGSVVADVMITVSLCILLGSIRTGFKPTDSLVNTLMLYTINTGLLTSVSAIACFVTFAIWPHAFVFIGFYFVLSKLYINSLLAMLNTRERLRKRNTGITSVPSSPSCLEPLPINTTFMAVSRAEEEFAVAKPMPVRPAWNNFKETQTI